MSVLSNLVSVVRFFSPSTQLEFEEFKDFFVTVV